MLGETNKKTGETIKNSAEGATDPETLRQKDRKSKILERDKFSPKE